MFQQEIGIKAEKQSQRELEGTEGGVTTPIVYI